VLSALEESGESLASFAKREGLSPERLYRWRRKLTKQAFVEIERAPVRTEGAGVLEVVVATGRVVRVPPDFDADALQRLLAVLEADAC
jgi:transposase-like protein